jgi:hypothetical protein
MLSSELLSPVVTRRWLQPTADTSNLRNGVGRPWEVYHAGQHANSSILDIFMKSGEIGHYSSYFGLSPDFNVGFAILAHDTETEAPDLNVHADVVSLGIEGLISIAGVQLGMNYIGEYSSDGPEGNFTAKFGMTNAPGLVVEAMQLDDTNILEIVADAAGIALENLDLRAYPSNAASSNTRQFVLVAQDISAPVDMGTPTCVTWKLVGILGPQVPSTVVFEVDEDGQATDAYIVF